MHRRILVHLSIAHPFHNLLDQHFARSASCTSPRGIHHHFQASAATLNALTNSAFADAVAVTHLRAVRHLKHCLTLRRCSNVEQ